MPFTCRAEPGCDLGISFNDPIAQVASVAAGSPAALAGIKEGDMVMAINGVFTFSLDQVRSKLDSYACGDHFEVMVTNFATLGESRTASVTLLRRDPAAGQAPSGITSDATLLSDGGEQNAAGEHNGFLRAIDESLAAEAKAAVASLERSSEMGFLRGYYLGKKNFPGEGARKFWSEVLMDNATGTAAPRFYFITPYSEARYMFYRAGKQFESLDVSSVVARLRSMTYAYIVVDGDAGQEDWSHEFVGQRSDISSAKISKVVIQKNGETVQAIHSDENGWAFPLGIFDQSGEFEIIAVTSDDRQVKIGPKPKNWEDVR
jgi:hypothetical protein